MTGQTAIKYACMELEGIASDLDRQKVKAEMVASKLDLLKAEIRAIIGTLIETTKKP